MINIVLNLDLLIRTFFIRGGESGVFQWMDWGLVSGLYWKIHVSLPITTFSSKSDSIWIRLRMFEQMILRLSFWSAARIFETIFAQIFVMFNWLCKIDIYPLRNHSNTQSTVIPDNFADFGSDLLRWNYDYSSRMVGWTFYLFTALDKVFMSLENLWSRHATIPIYLLRELIASHCKFV